jgi:thiol-disulfide isomerase/thioredoxin
MSDFNYKVVFFTRPGCPACTAMKPVWAQVAREVEEEYPHYHVGFGEWDVETDDWAFCDSIGCDGTPNFAIFSDDNSLLGINTDGLLAPSQFKSFIISTVERNR